MEFQTIDPFEAYLDATKMIDYRDALIQTFLAGTDWRNRAPEERTRRAFLFVRDEIAHSWDIQSRTVTRTASEVLQHGVGICYAKSHLLAALLRALAIPAGVCYQRLTLFEEPENGFALHALNAAYLGDKWVRFDARGNKPGVNAEFSLTEERLAFPIRPEKGEIDYKTIHAEPAECIVKVLTDFDDQLEMFRHGLPSELD